LGYFSRQSTDFIEVHERHRRELHKYKVKDVVLVKEFNDALSLVCIKAGETCGYMFDTELYNKLGGNFMPFDGSIIEDGTVTWVAKRGVFISI